MSEAQPPTSETAKDEDLALEFVPIHNGSEGQVIAYDAQGNEVPVPDRLVIIPFFDRNDSLANIGYTRALAVSKSGERAISSGVLRTSARTGKVTQTIRVRVKPQLLTNTK